MTDKLVVEIVEKLSKLAEGLEHVREIALPGIQKAIDKLEKKIDDNYVTKVEFDGVVRQHDRRITSIETIIKEVGTGGWRIVLSILGVVSGGIAIIIALYEKIFTKGV